MYQKIIVVGYLGRDPEMRYMPDGTAVTNFNMASSRRYNDRSGQQVDETTWFRVSVWGRQAESVNEYLSKGKQVLVEGRLRPDPNTGGPRLYTRQDGTMGSSFEISADTVRFIGSRDGTAGGGYSEEESFAGAPAGGSAAQEEDDIPF
jgi:single-strand DNA-binding protein